MTSSDHDAQRARVRASLDADEGREHHRDVYARHPLARVVPQGEPTVASLAQSIRELGEMLAKADQHPDFRARVIEVERLHARLADRCAALYDVICGEYADAGDMGGSDGLGAA